MDYNIPSYISPATLVKATRLVKNSKSLKLGEGSAFWDDLDVGSGKWPGRDYVYFMFTKSNNDLAVIHCTPTSYLVQLITEDESVTDFAMVSNIRHFLLGIRRLGFTTFKSRKDNDSRA